MSIFIDLFNDVGFALNKKKMKNLKAQQIQINELNNKLINLNSKLQTLNRKSIDLDKELFETLDKHNFHQQNLHAKKDGFKSAFQYKMRIKSDTFNAKQKLIDLNKQQEKYNEDLKKNQEELTKINNNLLFYNNIQKTFILGSIVSFLILVSYMLLAINPKFLFDNVNNYIVYCSILGFCISISCLINFIFDKVLYQKLELGKLHIYNYIYPILSIANILVISMPLNSAKPYILFVFYLLITIFIAMYVVRNEILFKNNKSFCFSLDFILCNSPFVNFTVITVINSNLINNDILSLIIKIIYLVSVLMYGILFIWEAITNWNNEKDFKQYIFLIISILLLLAFILCAVLNFVPNFLQAIEFIASIGGIISLFSFLFQGFRKSSSKIDDKVE